MISSGFRGFIIGIFAFFMLYSFVHPDVGFWLFRPSLRPRIEATLNLQTIARLQENYYRRHGSYARTLEEIDWPKPFDGYYNYFMNDMSIVRDLNINIVHNTVEGHSIFFALAVGNLDDDDTLDVLLIDESERLVNIVDDTNRQGTDLVF